MPFSGPLLAIGLLLLWQNDLRAVLVGRGGASGARASRCLFSVSRMSARGLRPGAAQPLTLASLGSLGRRYWVIVALGSVITLARFSEAFLVLRGQQLGLPLAWVPAIIMIMSLVYAGSAYPAGLAARRWSRRTLLGWGLVVLILADVVLATAGTVAPVLIGAGLWGLHMGLTQGLLAALVADAVPAERAGTAFGFFNLVTGLFLLAGEQPCRTVVGQFGRTGNVSCRRGLQCGGPGRPRALSPLGRQRLLHGLTVRLTRPPRGP